MNGVLRRAELSGGDGDLYARIGGGDEAWPPFRSR
jgi:hypothetical protein